jgi:TetR/AcrR family transcriptional regulator
MAAPMTQTAPDHAPPAPTDGAARILAAAESLFAELGFDAVSMSEIAERAGVSKANIFHHFKTKKDLYIEVVRSACRDASQHLDNLGSEDAPLAERLAGFAGAHLASLLERGAVTRLILRELLGDNPHQGKELAERVYGDKFARFVAILKAGQAAGELRADIDPAAVATALIGANVFYFEAQAVLRHFPDVRFAEQPERYSALLADILLRGILPAAGPTATTTNRNRS